MSDPNWIETSSGNRIHKTCKIKGTTQIMIGGLCTIESHSKLIASEKQSPISIGKYCYFNNNVTLDTTSTPGRSANNGIKIGSYSFINHDTKVYGGVTIGNRVKIGKNCRIRKGTIIHDCCIIEDGVELVEDSIIAPFSKVGMEQSGIDDEDVSYNKIIVHPIDPSVKIVNEDFVKTASLLGV